MKALQPIASRSWEKTVHRTRGSSESSSANQTIFYVAKHVAQTGDPVSFLLAEFGDADHNAAKRWFAEQTGDVYVPLVSNDPRTGRTIEDGYVFVAPRAQGAPWEVYFTSELMRQAEYFGRDGPITSEEEADSLAATLGADLGADFRVFRFT